MNVELQSVVESASRILEACRVAYASPLPTEVLVQATNIPLFTYMGDKPQSLVADATSLR